MSYCPITQINTPQARALHRLSIYNFAFSPSAFFASFAARSIIARVSVAASAR